MSETYISISTIPGKMIFAPIINTEILSISAEKLRKNGKFPHIDYLFRFRKNVCAPTLVSNHLNDLSGELIDLALRCEISPGGPYGTLMTPARSRRFDANRHGISPAFRVLEIPVRNLTQFPGILARSDSDIAGFGFPVWLRAAPRRERILRRP